MVKTSSTIGVLILAAGQGKRMRSSLPKVLHPLAGVPMLVHVLARVKAVLPEASVAIVVGHAKEQVESVVRAHPLAQNMKIEFVFQKEQLGTGHAARVAMDTDWGKTMVKKDYPVLVLPGDLPLITEDMIQQLCEPMGRGVSTRLLTTRLIDPTGYGRVVRKGKVGPVLRVVEEKDAGAREKDIREVATSIYTFDPGFLKSGTHRITPKNAQKEYYLTDLIALSTQAKKKIDVLEWPSPEDLRGVNDPWELALASKIINERIIKKFAQNGVRFTNPWTTIIDATVQIEAGAEIDSGVLIKGTSTIAADAHIGPRCILEDVTVSQGAYLKVGTVAEKSHIGARAVVGPYAHLRPESKIGEDAKIGNFVELKKTTIGKKTSVAHLSYLGDATVGEGVNIGCGFVTCNFDGRVVNGERKHKTVIEDGVFVGSDCQTIAPIVIGKGAYLASGSTITQDVPADALGIARSRQVNKEGYAKRLRPQTDPKGST